MSTQPNPTNGCQYDGCNLPTLYALFKTYQDGRKVWLSVCKLHEKVIGAENLMRAGGYVENQKGGDAAN